MSWKMYLDDVRPAPPGWTRVQNIGEVFYSLGVWGPPEEMSLDHDLGIFEPSWESNPAGAFSFLLTLFPVSM